MTTAFDMYHKNKRIPCKYFAGIEPFGDVSYGVCQAEAPPLLINLEDGKTVNYCELNNRSCEHLPKSPSEEAKKPDVSKTRASHSDASVLPEPRRRW